MSPGYINTSLSTNAVTGDGSKYGSEQLKYQLYLGITSLTLQGVNQTETKFLMCVHFLFCFAFIKVSFRSIGQIQT